VGVARGGAAVPGMSGAWRRDCCVAQQGREEADKRPSATQCGFLIVQTIFKWIQLELAKIWPSEALKFSNKILVCRY
jgi:hypothetical protein